MNIEESVSKNLIPDNRRSIRLKEYDYSSPGAYFVTVVAYPRVCIFGGAVDGKMKFTFKACVWARRDPPLHLKHNNTQNYFGYYYGDFHNPAFWIWCDSDSWLNDSSSLSAYTIYKILLHTIQDRYSYR
jgi:hypothetical protein